MKSLIYFICGLLILSSCNKSSDFVITGTIENGEEKTVTFSELLINGTNDIQSVKLDKKGNFKIKSSTDIPRFYQLSVSKSNFLSLLVGPGEKVKINAHVSDMSKASISGSEGSALVLKLNRQLVETRQKLDSISKYVKSIQGTELFDQQINDLNASYRNIVNAQRDSSISFIIKNLNSLSSIVALYQKYDDKNYVLYKNRDLQYIKIVSEALVKKYPESQHVKALIADKENLFKRYNQLKTNIKLSELANTDNVLSIPEIYLPNEDGDSISLNAVHGKYVLLNFWATWSQESIQQNIELKEVYQKYHAKGFEIYQVSLDTKIENWTRLIHFDQLPWINVIDINGRTSYYAKIYNVSNLPTSYLINPDGDIFLVNPTKNQLLSTFEYALK